MDEVRSRRLLQLKDDADLSDLKKVYGQYRQRIEAQLDSADPSEVVKGRNNMQLLDQAYQVLAPVVAARNAPETPQAPQGTELKMSVELGTCRVGFHINRIEGFQVASQRNQGHFKISWPGGKMIFYNDKVKIKALIFKAEIEYQAIDEIRRYWFMPMVFQIKHHQPDVWPTVIVHGFGVGRKIKDLNEQHRLGLNLTY